MRIYESLMESRLLRTVFVFIDLINLKRVQNIQSRFLFFLDFFSLTRVPDALSKL
jgi:hypothetical protein